LIKQAFDIQDDSSPATSKKSGRQSKLVFASGICENTKHSIQSLRKILPAALKSVASEAINRYYHRCIRVLDAYATGYKYGSTAFEEYVYKGHRQVVQVDKPKWWS
jgi:hypothetical protein